MTPSKFFSGLLLGVACFSSLPGAARAQDLKDALVEAGFTVMAVALEAVGFDAVIGDIEVPITVFAPDNEAFESALTAYPNLNDDALLDILAYHITGSEYSYEDLVDAAKNGKIIKSAVPPQGVWSSGYTIDSHCKSSGKGKGSSTSDEDCDEYFIRDALISGGDIYFDGGVIQEIDAVIIPPTVDIEDYA